MPLIQNIVTVAAGATIDNLLAGSQFEFLPYDSVLEFGINGATTGGNLIFSDVYSGQDVLMENAPLNALGRVPIYPDDFVLNDVAAAGERVKVRVRNTDVAARQVFFAVRVTAA